MSPSRRWEGREGGKDEFRTLGSTQDTQMSIIDSRSWSVRRQLQERKVRILTIR